MPTVGQPKWRRVKIICCGIVVSLCGLTPCSILGVKAQESRATETDDILEWEWSDDRTETPDFEPEWSTTDFSWGDNLRWAVDLSTRVDYTSDSGAFAYTNIVGIDVHKVFSGRDGDWGTLNIQEYLTRFDNLDPRPVFVEGEDDWEIVHRITSFNYTGLFGGLLNFKFGHIEMPFGIEVPIDTNGTVRQLNTIDNLGLQTDWGVGVNGHLPGYQYEFILSRGTGQEFHRRDDPYVVCGRIGTPSEELAGYGVSVFHGRVLGANEATRRTRFAVDGWWSGGGAIGLLGEVAIGDDDGRGVVNFLGEANWLSSREEWEIYGQFRTMNRRRSRWEDAEMITAGIRWTPGSHWALSVQLAYSVATFSGVPKGGVGMVQARYRFH